MELHAQSNGEWRPMKGGYVALNDEQLAKIGLMVVYEAGAKHAVAAALKTVTQDSRPLADIEKPQFSQLMTTLAKAIAGADPQLVSRLTDVETALHAGHVRRHQVVHSVWGEGGDLEPVAHDHRRKQSLSASDIDEALEACAELKRAAHWMLFRVAELVEHGTYPERNASLGGVNVRTNTRLVRL